MRPFLYFRWHRTDDSTWRKSASLTSVRSQQNQFDSVTRRPSLIIRESFDTMFVYLACAVSLTNGSRDKSGFEAKHRNKHLHTEAWRLVPEHPNCHTILVTTSCSYRLTSYLFHDAPASHTTMILSTLDWDLPGEHVSA